MLVDNREGAVWFDGIRARAVRSRPGISLWSGVVFCSHLRIEKEKVVKIALR